MFYNITIADLQKMTANQISLFAAFEGEKEQAETDVVQMFQTDSEIALITP